MPGIVGLPYPGGNPHSPRRGHGSSGPSPVGEVPNPAGDILKRLTHGRAKTTDSGVVNVGALRRMLIAHGYRLPAHGNGMGKLMKSALADFLNPQGLKKGGAIADALSGTKITGNRDPQAWNKRYAPVGPDGRSVVAIGPGKTLDKHGNPQPGNAEQAGPAAHPQTVNLRALGRVAAAAGTPIPTSLAAQLANNSAGEQFDPQIHDVQQLLSQEPVDAAQHTKDIANWYGQVVNALGTAGKRDKAATSAGIGSLKDAVSAIAQSLGGGANKGGADVASMGANDVGTLQALGLSQDMLNNDMAPILSSERASQLTNQSNKDALAKSQLEQQLEDLQGQRGQAAGAQKASTLLQILGSNNATAQQNFQNRLALQQAGEAAQLNGLKALYYGSRANQPTKGSFGYATPTEINGVENAVLAHILDANGNLQPGMTQAKAAQIARTVGSSYFPSGGVPAGWAQSVIAPYFG